MPRTPRLVQPRDGRRQTVGRTLEPEEMQKQESDQDEGHDPRGHPIECSAAALGADREQRQWND